MWGNWEVPSFIDWPKSYNENLSTNKRIGFYGLDVSSCREYIKFIMQYLEKNDPKALDVAKKQWNALSLLENMKDNRMLRHPLLFRNYVKKKY